MKMEALIWITNTAPPFWKKLLKIIIFKYYSSILELIINRNVYNELSVGILP